MLTINGSKLVKLLPFKNILLFGYILRSMIIKLVLALYQNRILCHLKLLIAAVKLANIRRKATKITHKEEANGKSHKLKENTFVNEWTHEQRECRMERYNNQSIDTNIQAEFANRMSASACVRVCVPNKKI